ncbi:MAG: hypothetical protein JWO62_2063 [Acidimicrobiaceae bacterium]|nr:hypothetical protein [Acidimicrobiaceae bacterium]
MDHVLTNAPEFVRSMRTAGREIARRDRGQIDDRPGTGITPSAARWVRIVLGPQLECARRISSTRASMLGIIWCGQLSGHLVNPTTAAFGFGWSCDSFGVALLGSAADHPAAHKGRRDGAVR